MRARALAADWRYHTWLLEKTLDSILAQTHPAFEAVVVCHDIPDIRQAAHPQVHILPVDIPVPARTNDDMCLDKVLKISAGVEWALKRGSDYVMFVDADDLVSRRLSAFVAAHHGANGWYFHDGFVHTYGERWVRVDAPHHLVCGTSAIVRADLLRSAPSDFCRGAVVNTLADAGHNLYEKHLAEGGTPIAPLPFPGAVYVLHPDSTSQVAGGAGYWPAAAGERRPGWRRTLRRVRQAARRIGTMRPITPRLRAEFTIPSTSFRPSR